MLNRPPTIEIRLLDRPVDYVPIDGDLLQGGGGECVFLGRTRRDTHPQHGQLVRLSYEAYASMAENVLRRLAQQAIDRFGCLFVRIHHALGEVPPDKASVLVQTVCAHRAEAFDACRFLIGELKFSAPIWKREEWADGMTWSPGVPAKTEGEMR